MSQMDFVLIVSSAYLACLSREAYEAKAYKAVFSSQKDDMRKCPLLFNGSHLTQCAWVFFFSFHLMKLCTGGKN